MSCSEMFIVITQTVLKPIMPRYNLRSDGSLDSRTHHTGCPVVRGNKWIANKWIKWHEQMGTRPCSRQRGQHYADTF